VHFYEAKSMKDSPLGDIQRLDIGIALAHFEMSLEEKGIRGTYASADPGIPVPEGTLYVISYHRL